MIVLSSAQPCQLHQSHSPHAETSEWHHIVPVDWQLDYLLPVDVAPPSPGKDPDGRGMLWDNRGIYLCPTGHRNVHYWISKMMHAVAEQASVIEDDPMRAFAAVVHGSDLARLEPALAREGLERFAQYGSLLWLTTQHDWGQA